MTRVGWLDCTCGVSGDMLLGALESLGALDDLPAVLDSLPDVRVRYQRLDGQQRGGLDAVGVRVDAGGEQPRRTLNDVLAIIERAAAPAVVIARARAVFARLANAEAAVHGIATDDVHFHEVGAVDAVVDVLGACLGVHALGLDELVVSPIALGGGTASTGHGAIPIPGPAVLELLRGSTLLAHGGPIDVELATPTGVALLAELGARTGPMPQMRVERIGLGAGERDIPQRPNVVRIVVGDSAGATDRDSWLMVEANVDDLDPRVWPIVLERMLASGAVDAWLTPIIMKKGRPAHTIGALVTVDKADDVRRCLLTETPTIGLRSFPVDKMALERSWVDVEVDGQPLRIKVATLDGAIVTATPEFDDVARAALALDRPVRWVLAKATAAAGGLLS
jgi:uncharacterized protein (TIGR00299 family) protein